MHKFVTVNLILLFLPHYIAAQDTAKVKLSGQIAAWTTMQLRSPIVVQPGVRFVPELTAKFSTTEMRSIDVAASVNVNGHVTFEQRNETWHSIQLKPYRVWARYSTPNFEIRAGLQKINFGQAKLFRPLMWFDAMDVRDPFQLTDGVYGLLTKYFFSNNASIWTWALLGNDKQRGWDLFACSKWKPEFGGRIEMPVLEGEMAFTTHYRKVNAFHIESTQSLNYTRLNEHKIGFDGKWDIGMGVWFENSSTITETNNYNIPKLQHMFNIGLDYTFAIGNGIGATVEYLRYHAGKTFFRHDNTLHLVGSIINYPLSITSQLSAILFYLPTQQNLFSYASWNISNNNWSFYLIGYWNPMNAQIPVIQTSSKNLFAGKGMQFMASYNF